MLKVFSNFKGFFSDTRRRNIFLLTFFIALLITAFSMVYFYKKMSTDSTARLNSAPGGIESIPGSLNPTDEYASLQKEENIRNARQAQASGTSAIPTLINSQSFGDGISSEQLQTEGGLYFSTLEQSQQALDGDTKSLWTEDLQNTNCSQEAIEEAIRQGATAEDILEICGCDTLRENGYSAEQLHGFGLDATQLRSCGFSAAELRDAGFSPTELKDAGFNATELRDAGFSAAQLRDAGFSAAELKDAGFSAAQLRDAGFSASDLRDAGYSAQDLLDAGFTPQQLKDAGFSAAQLRDAGLSAQQLKDAGFNKDELAAAGFSPDDLDQLDFSDGLNPDRASMLADLGCASPELKDAGFSATELKKAGCSAADLKDAGFSAAQLRDAGFTPQELKDAGFSAAQLRDAGFTPQELKDAGFTPQELKDAGFSAQELRDAGFTPQELKDAGFTPQELKDAGFTPQELKDAGFTPHELKDAGFTPEELKDAGIDPGIDTSASDPVSDRRVGQSDESSSCNVQRISQLAQAGASAAQLKTTLNCSIDQLRQQGFSDDALRDAGYSDNELQAAGIDPQEQAAGVSSEDDGEQDQAGNNEMTSGEGSTSLEDENQQLFDEVVSTTPTNMPTNTTSNDLQHILEMQTAQMTEQQKEQDSQQRQSAILGQMGQLTEQWGPVSIQSYVAGNPPEPEDIGAANPGISGDAIGNANKPMIRAGDIIFAVLDTAVNSDEPGPVLASIVSGELKGAKLLGSLSTTADGSKVIVNFNTMALPDESGTISISAFAIDPDTARTALSSNTNRHILMRYSTLFASAFAEGVGNAFASSGTTVSQGGIGVGQTITTAQRTLPENLVVGTGEVGRRFGQNLSPIFNRPPTVEVYAGTGMGILFTADVSGAR